MDRIAYFGTYGNNKAGHYFMAIRGEFTRDEEKQIKMIDTDVFDSLVKYDGGFQFFMWHSYGCLAFPANPDDDRGGCKTVIFVENTNKKIEVLEAVNASPFVKRQFDRLAAMYKKDMPKIEQLKQ